MAFILRRMTAAEKQVLLGTYAELKAERENLFRLQFKPS